MRMDSLDPAPVEESWQLRHVGIPSTIDKSSSIITLLTDGEVSVGRGPKADYFLDSMIYVRLISRIHAVITGEHLPTGHVRFVLKNTGLNGTYINDFKLGVNEGNSQILHEGDKVAFGHINCGSIRVGEYAPQPQSEFQFLVEKVRRVKKHQSKEDEVVKTKPFFSPYPSDTPIYASNGDLPNGCDEIYHPSSPRSADVMSEKENEMLQSGHPVHSFNHKDVPGEDGKLRETKSVKGNGGWVDNGKSWTHKSKKSDVSHSTLHDKTEGVETLDGLKELTSNKSYLPDVVPNNIQDPKIDSADNAKFETAEKNEDMVHIVDSDDESDGIKVESVTSLAEYGLPHENRGRESKILLETSSNGKGKKEEHRPSSHRSVDCAVFNAGSNQIPDNGPLVPGSAENKRIKSKFNKGQSDLENGGKISSPVKSLEKLVDNETEKKARLSDVKMASKRKLKYDNVSETVLSSSESVKLTSEVKRIRRSPSPVVVIEKIPDNMEGKLWTHLTSKENFSKFKSQSSSPKKVKMHHLHHHHNFDHNVHVKLSTSRPLSSKTHKSPHGHQDSKHKKKKLHQDCQSLILSSEHNQQVTTTQTSFTKEIPKNSDVLAGSPGKGFSPKTPTTITDTSLIDHHSKRSASPPPHVLPSSPPSSNPRQRNLVHPLSRDGRTQSTGFACALYSSEDDEEKLPNTKSQIVDKIFSPSKNPKGDGVADEKLQHVKNKSKTKKSVNEEKSSPIAKENGGPVTDGTAELGKSKSSMANSGLRIEEVKKASKTSEPVKKTDNRPPKTTLDGAKTDHPSANVSPNPKHKPKSPKPPTASSSSSSSTTISSSSSLHVSKNSTPVVSADREKKLSTKHDNLSKSQTDEKHQTPVKSSHSSTHKTDSSSLESHISTHTSSQPVAKKAKKIPSHTDLTLAFLSLKDMPSTLKMKKKAAESSAGNKTDVKTSNESKSSPKPPNQISDSSTTKEKESLSPSKSSVSKSPETKKSLPTPNKSSTVLQQKESPSKKLNQNKDSSSANPTSSHLKRKRPSEEERLISKDSVEPVPDLSPQSLLQILHKRDASPKKNSPKQLQTHSSSTSSPSNPSPSSSSATSSISLVPLFPETHTHTSKSKPKKNSPETKKPLPKENNTPAAKISKQPSTNDTSGKHVSISHSPKDTKKSKSHHDSPSPSKAEPHTAVGSVSKSERNTRQKSPARLPPVIQGKQLRQRDAEKNKEKKDTKGQLEMKDFVEPAMTREDNKSEGNRHKLSSSKSKLSSAPHSGRARVPNRSSLATSSSSGRKSGGSSKKKKRPSKWSVASDSSSDEEMSEMEEREEDWSLEDGVQYCDTLCGAKQCRNPVGQKVDWVMCDRCEDWYHVVCVNTTIEQIEKDGDQFVCALC